jgi:hypothetical protein
MKSSKREIQSRVHKMPLISFVDQTLTSFAGLIVFQPLLSNLDLKARLRSCFSHLSSGSIFGHHFVVLLLVVHLILGFRRLRDVQYYKDDPLVKRILGLNKMPDIATVSRALADADEMSVSKARALCRSLVLERLRKLALARVTLDFDGTVLSTSRKAEGTAVGFNKKKKGARSYYPLFCTLAQTGQVFDFHHRPGNVHDSKGACEFIMACISVIRQEMPSLTIEARLDSAFFSDEVVTMLDEAGVKFTISVPFERFAELKKMVEAHKRWKAIDDTWSFFENSWKPKAWNRRFRFVFIRQECRIINKEPIQLDLFIPHEYGFEFKVIVTNKGSSAKKILLYHNGRGSQENVFGELKTQTQLEYVAVRHLHGNQIYMIAAILAHNLNRELQMATMPAVRGTTVKRAPMWGFIELATLRHRLIQRAGRLTHPSNRLTLTMGANEAVKAELLRFLEGLQQAA